MLDLLTNQNIFFPLCCTTVQSHPLNLLTPPTPRKNHLLVKSTLRPGRKLSRKWNSTSSGRVFHCTWSQVEIYKRKKFSFLFSLIFNFKVDNFFACFHFSFINSHLCQGQCEWKCSNVGIYLGIKLIKCMFILKINIGSYTELLLKAFCINLYSQIFYFIGNENIMHTLWPVEFHFWDSFLWSKGGIYQQMIFSSAM